MDVQGQLTSAEPFRPKGQNQLPLSLWKTQPANFRSLAAISCWAVPCRHHGLQCFEDAAAGHQTTGDAC